MRLSNKAFVQFFICVATTLLSHSNTQAFTLTTTNPQNAIQPTATVTGNPSASALQMSASSNDIASLNLTPQLESMTRAFGSIPDEKLRYKQLLYMAGQLQPLDPSLATQENKVPGCLSTVFVHCTPETKFNEETEENETVLNYVGDSDGLLTKGLVALLIRGLSGCTAEQIQKVDPEFIAAAGITQSLTPGRNNGFLNMLAVMKAQALKYSQSTTDTDGDASSSTSSEQEEEANESSFIASFEEVAGKPMYNEMMPSLLKLKPVRLELIDESHQHAGHAGSKGWEESGESHFNLTIVADAFEGLSLVKRHQLIYLLLGDTMEKIHALQISAKSSNEV
jgi:sulfur transfer protein SufE/stress-induced morphogen